MILGSKIRVEMIYLWLFTATATALRAGMQYQIDCRESPWKLLSFYY